MIIPNLLRKRSQQKAAHTAARNLHRHANIVTSLVFCILFSAASMSFSAPAAWQKWRSKTNSVTVCAQVSPGDAWERVDGPFRDARCQRRGRPG